MLIVAESNAGAMPESLRPRVAVPTEPSGGEVRGIEHSLSEIFRGYSLLPG